MEGKDGEEEQEEEEEEDPEAEAEAGGSASKRSELLELAVSPRVVSPDESSSR